MGNDLGDGFKLGIILITSLALVVIIFSLITMMRDAVDSGALTINTGLEVLSESEFEDFDQTFVTGYGVKAAIKTFQGRDVAVGVRTILGKNNSRNAQCYGALLDVTHGELSSGGTDYGYTFDFAVDENKSIESKDDYHSGEVNKVFEYKGDNFFTCNLKIEDGHTIHNDNLRPLDSTNTRAFVRDSATFKAQLIKSYDGVITGVMFTQVE